ncbi:hypothetical protein NQ317_005099 [Molorchus minor]|uniref:Uncharacterized protein n=1 Tax=Molorchus minor TaxID=1323400 RepID=A0ABQ9JHQ2_9CUCU|nr:hypothetical protein NQ317_005099 [Molorchus minor]
MTANKFVCVIYLLVILVTCQGALVGPRISDDHNIDTCDVTKAKKQLIGSNVYEEGVFLTIIERVINYPENSISTDIITCIRVIDMDSSNQGGYPRVVNGGVGSTEVQLLLKSQIGQPLNFRIEIWADE